MRTYEKILYGNNFYNIQYAPKNCTIRYVQYDQQKLYKINLYKYNFAKVGAGKIKIIRYKRVSYKEKSKIFEKSGFALYSNGYGCALYKHKK